MLTESNYAELPNASLLTIGEVCKLCNVKPHVLRYWENLYKKELSGIVRRNSRRYYKPAHVHTIRKIAELKKQGLASAGVMAALSGKNQLLPQPPVTGIDYPRLRTEISSLIKLLDS